MTRYGLISFYLCVHCDLGLKARSISASELSAYVCVSHWCTPSECIFVVHLHCISTHGTLVRGERSSVYPTRLETRTKESSMCASHWVLRNLKAKWKWKLPFGSLGVILCLHGRNTVRSQLLSNMAAKERTRWDPKDGELCLSRMKPEETLVEVRSGSDVQIDRQTWV